MAKISTVREVICLAKEANITPWIWGERGIGKSSIVRQTCAANDWGFIDLRCSQMEASDIRGLPDRVEGRTRYLPPDDLPIGDMTIEQIRQKMGERPDNTEENLEAVRQYNIRFQSLQKHYPHGILFLDELNRAADDVIQATFQLVLDRAVGSYVLPPGWGIVAAGNFMEGAYTTNNFTDAAFLNRFSHITLSAKEATSEEWVSWMSQEHGANASGILEFIGANVNHLDGDVKGELGFSVQPSRRSWDAVCRIEAIVRQNRDKYDPESVFALEAGLIGQDLARSFSRYSCPVKPLKLLEEGVAKYASQIKKLTRQQLQGVTWGLISYTQDRLSDQKVADVCLDFMQLVAEDCNDKDMAIALGHTLITSDFQKSDDQRTAMSMIGNNSLGKYVIKALEKQHGQDGAKKMFIHKLNERPGLQQLMRDTVWHSDPDNGEGKLGLPAPKNAKAKK